MDWLSIATVVGFALSEILAVCPKGPDGIIHAIGKGIARLFGK